MPGCDTKWIHSFGRQNVFYLIKRSKQKHTQAGYVLIKYRDRDVIIPNFYWCLYDSFKEVGL